jgi:hypothetical protein
MTFTVKVTFWWNFTVYVDESIVADTGEPAGHVVVPELPPPVVVP